MPQHIFETFSPTFFDDLFSDFFDDPELRNCRMYWAVCKSSPEIVECIEPFAKVPRKCWFYYGFLKVGVTNHRFLQWKMLPGSSRQKGVGRRTLPGPFNTRPLEPLQSKTVWGKICQWSRDTAGSQSFGWKMLQTQSQASISSWLDIPGIRKNSVRKNSVPMAGHVSPKQNKTKHG